MADGEVRVVLVKPGDVLLIGNVGSIGSPENLRGFVDGLHSMGVKAFVFAADIDIDKLPEGGSGQ